jgi:NADPH-dependent 2,4-dienoyl-CoA reductase/sulfur reductase-like enzyme/nitrite reductase/ring-hydroxylating ferredoxin subunit
MAESRKPTGPDFQEGFLLADVPPDGVVAGRVGDKAAVLVRDGDTLVIVGGKCTHYSGPLAEGLVVGGTIRCPLHHACFDLRTGEPLRAPALDPIPCWRVEQVGDRVFARERLTPPAPKPIAASPESVVIVGGGAAGLAAADMLRRRGYAGLVTMISADADPPVDRPNLSKDYLAGEAQEDWIPLWSPDLFAEHRIDLVLGRRVSTIDAQAKTVTLDDGSKRNYGALLIATGADPVRIPVPGASAEQVLYLRSFADSKAIVARAAGAKRVVVVGASFIGLEVAASLRARGIAVDVVAPDKLPLERVMGPEIGHFVQKLHESHGVTFHLGETVQGVKGRTVTTSSGKTLEADFLVLGVGVKPAVELAEKAGLAVDRGITVNRQLQTSKAGIFAAGDNARWPDPHTGANIRVEHWVVAQRMGQVAAENILGAGIAFDAVPFFWSQHYDVTIRYVGHAEKWDAIKVEGNLDAHDCTVNFTVGPKTIAVATIGRDQASLKSEASMERPARA